MVPTTTIYNQTLSYDRRTHTVRKPNGKILETYPGYSPSDLICYAQTQPFTEDIRQQLIDFGRRCLMAAASRRTDHD